MKRKEFKKAMHNALIASSDLRLHERVTNAKAVERMVRITLRLKRQVRQMVKSEESRTADIMAVFVDLAKRDKKGCRMNLMAALEQIRYIVEGDAE